MTCVGSSPSSTQPEREPDQPGALEDAGVVRLCSAGLARLAEKDHAEELDHDVGGERRRQRDHRGAERQAAC